MGLAGRTRDEEGGGDERRATNKTYQQVGERAGLSLHPGAIDGTRGFDWIGRSIAYCIGRISKSLALN